MPDAKVQSTCHALAFVAVFAIAIAARAESATTQAADPTARTTTRPATTQSGEKGDRLVVTEHELRLGDRTLRYTATAGTMAQKDQSGAVKADMFFVAYTLDRGENADPRTRPVTFVFNGGPGAASVWLHLGTAGPRRIDLHEAAPAKPPFRLVDNESTWLDATDLVFIDPVGTGYSRPAQGEKGEQFYGVDQDVRSVGSFIRLYTTRNRRWDSPKFLAGESYGTTRAAGLSSYLLEEAGISLNGVVLISAVLNFQTISASPGNDLPYSLFLPTYTAAAIYHKKLSDEHQRDPERTLREVERFALTDYAAALAAGDGLDDARRTDVAQRLARYTGLGVEYVRKSNLRIEPSRFRQQLLASDGKLIGRFDARMTGLQGDGANDAATYDPSLSLVLPVYAATFNNYVRTVLNFDSDLPYEVLAELEPWNLGTPGAGYLNVTGRLRSTMLQNPQLKLLVCAGRLDLATPYLGSDYTIDHLDLPSELRGNITRAYFPAGHMMYHDTGSRRQLHEDVTGFMRKAWDASSTPTTTK